MSELIARISKASDAYGNPFLTEFMKVNRISGLWMCFADPAKYIPLAEEYIKEKGL